MKLAHYLHIPPRMVFLAQGLATLIGALTQCGVTVYMVTRVHNICAMNNEDGYTCPHGRVTYSSSLIWGLSLSPLQAYQSSPGCLYANLCMIL
jgi:phage shock protein PspC (stress-responsive transcriptional regulator)